MRKPACCLRGPAIPSPEWIVEHGIGEIRAALVDRGRILEARVELEGAVPAGTLLRARLTGLGARSRNAIATDERGCEYLLPKAPAQITEGAELLIEVTREAIPGAEPWKRALARVGAGALRNTGSLAERLRSSGFPVREVVFPNSARDELSEAGWDELADQARSGEVEFAGGRLTMFLTPAMTLIDVDGWLEPAELAIRAAAEAARAIRRLDIGGSIGIDLPTVSGRVARQAAAATIDEHLCQPFERTAVNGFGFVQIVRPRLRPSLIEIWADRPAAEARALLRTAALQRAGRTTLVVNPDVAQVIIKRPHWLDALARQIGGAVSLRTEHSLPIHGAYAEAG